MNFLRGIIDAVPANGGIKAIRQIKYEYNSYFTKHFFLRFLLNKDFKLAPALATVYGERVRHESEIGLSFKDHNFYGHIYLFSKNSCATSQRWLWRCNVPRITGKLWNEEVKIMKFQFLDGEPIIHDQIHAAILKAMGKDYCVSCLGEKTHDHECKLYPSIHESIQEV